MAGCLRHQHLEGSHPVSLTASTFHFYCEKGKQAHKRGGFRFAIPAAFGNGWRWSDAWKDDFERLPLSKQLSCVARRSERFTRMVVDAIGGGRSTRSRERAWTQCKLDIVEAIEAFAAFCAPVSHAGCHLGKGRQKCSGLIALRVLPGSVGFAPFSPVVDDTITVVFRETPALSLLLNHSWCLIHRLCLTLLLSRCLQAAFNLGFRALKEQNSDIH